MKKRQKKPRSIVIAAVISGLLIFSTGWYIYASLTTPKCDGAAQPNSFDAPGSFCFYKKIPNGWSSTIDNTKTRFGLGMNGALGCSVTLFKVDDPSAKLSQASSISERLRNKELKSMIDKGWEIKQRAPSYIEIMTTSGRKNLSTIEWTSVAPFRYAESYAFYVKDGYYIKIHRGCHTDYDVKKTSEALLKMTDVALPTILVKD